MSQHVITTNHRTGHQYRGEYDFSEGATAPDGTFVPRYWGLARANGAITDTYRFRDLIPLRVHERTELPIASD